MIFIADPNSAAMLFLMFELVGNPLNIQIIRKRLRLPFFRQMPNQSHAPPKLDGARRGVKHEVGPLPISPIWEIELIFWCSIRKKQRSYPRITRITQIREQA